MRRPFLLLILVLGLFCWLKDLVNFLFYIFHSSSHVESAVASITGIGGVLASLYIAKKIYYPSVGFGDSVKDLFQTNRRKEWLLLLLVSLPVILLGLFRSVYPCECVDTYHYELYLQDYNFSETQHHFGLASLRTYFFPLPERIFSLFRHLFGYRFGAMLNTFIILTLLVSVYDFLKKFLSLYKPSVKYPAILLPILALFVITADYTLFNIGSYKTDLLGVPFLLELVYMVLFVDVLPKRIYSILFFLTASLVITLKLTFLPYTGIIGFVYYCKHFRKFSLPEKILLPLCVLAVPSIYLLYNQIETGSPLFPFFNKIFRSPLYPYSNFKDFRFGPRKFYETFIYPIVTFFNRQLNTEFGLYSYRLLFGYFANLITVIYCWIRLRSVKSPVLQFFLYLSALVIAFDYACIITTGYYRYGIIIEIVYGMVLALWLFHRPKKWIMAIIFLSMVFQTYDTVNNIYVLNRNLSWNYYQGLFHNTKRLKDNAKMMFHDYTDDKIKDPDNVIDSVDAFISMQPWAHDALGWLLKRNVPVYDLQLEGRTPDSVRKVEKEIVQPLTTNKYVALLATNEGMLGGMIRSVNERGYLATEIHKIYLPYFKVDEPLYVIRVKHLDTSRYAFKYIEQYLNIENPPDKRYNFTYRTKNEMTAFVEEAPYSFDWDFLPKSYDITINGKKITIADRLKDNKLFTYKTDSLIINKNNDVTYQIIIQEVEDKQKQ